MDNRIKYVDFLKGITIILMVMFHIHYVEAIQPLMKVVYSFHMPVFLFFSGYFIKFDNSLKVRLTRLVRSIVLPYIFFEILYIISLFVAGKLGLSFQNKIDELNLYLLLNKIIIQPIGAYWYLHTVSISISVIYLSFHFFKNKIDATIIAGFVCFLFCNLINGLKFENCIFIIVGICFKELNINVPFSFISFLVFILTGTFNLASINRGSIESLGMVLFYISFLGWIYNKYSKYSIINVFSFLGKNTLIIVLIHPIFLNFSRITYSFFVTIESTGILYLVFASVLTIFLSIFCSYILDKLKLSKLLFGKNIYVKFSSTR